MVTELLPLGVTGINLYLGSTGAERLAGSATSNTTTLRSLPLASAVGVPAGSAPVALSAPTAAPTAVAATAATGTTGFVQGTYLVRYTYLTASGETTASPASTVSVADKQAIQVTVGSLPVGASGASIYVGLNASTVQLAGSLYGTASAGTVPFAVNTPPALMAQPAPRQGAAVLADPTLPPDLVKASGTSPFGPGAYDVTYTFFTPEGETKASPIRSITLASGDTLQVTAGQALPPGATGMRVYLGPQGAKLNLVATVVANQADSVRPTASVSLPPGFLPVQAPTNVCCGPSAPTLSAVSLSTPTTLKAGTYYVAATDLSTNGETSPSAVSSVTITDGQGIQLWNQTPYRVYVGRSSSSLWLTSVNAPSPVTVTALPSSPVPPLVNTTQLSAPILSAVTLSALPSATYQVAYTFTKADGESGPSPVGAVSIAKGQSIHVDLPSLPAGVTGINLYLGTSPTTMALVQGTTASSVELKSQSSVGNLPLSPDGRGSSPPIAPTSGPSLTATTPTALSPGAYSVRYTFTDGDREIGPSPSTIIPLVAGQAMELGLPVLPAGMKGINIYAGAAGAERLVQSAVLPGQQTLVTAIPSNGSLVPTSGVSLSAPTVTVTTGGNLSGDVYASYTFFNALTGQESARSPETHKLMSGTNGTLNVTTTSAPSWATAVRVYVGSAPGTGKLVQTSSITPGSSVTVAVTQIIPGGAAIFALSHNWAEAEATWNKATTNDSWLTPGGDVDSPVAEASIGGGPTVTADLTRLIRQWAGGLIPNNGVLVRGTGAVTQFASSDHQDPSLRPVLTVTFREQSGVPTVSLATPATGSTVQGAVTLSATVVASSPQAQITRVDFYANGALLGTKLAPPYTLTWNTSNFPSGTYTIEARATDSLGQVGSSAWTSIITDSFDDTTGLELSQTTAVVDLEQGLLSATDHGTAVPVSSVSTSSVREPESYPAGLVFDSNNPNNKTFWRSVGQISPSSVDSFTFLTNSAASSISFVVYPVNQGAQNTIKVEALDQSGGVLYARTSSINSTQTVKTSYCVVPCTSIFAVRISPLQGQYNPVTGLYHSEFAQISSADAYAPAYTVYPGQPSYQADYGSENAIDNQGRTSWLSRPQSSASGVEWMELKLASPADSLYIHPVVDGLPAAIERYNSIAGGWEELLNVASLNEGVYPLPAGLAADRIRIKYVGLGNMTTTLGYTGGSAVLQPQYGVGLVDVIPYAHGSVTADREVTSRSVIMPAPAQSFLLNVTDSQPVGSGIDYYLDDGVTSYSITPGLPLTVPAPISSVRLKAVMHTTSPLAVPAVSAWRLSIQNPNQVTLIDSGDTLAPTADLPPFTKAYLQGTETIRSIVWDNVGVTRVELYADNGSSPVAVSTAYPFELMLDTTKLSPGKHYFWVKAYDQAGNVGGTPPATSTFSAFSDTLSDTSKVDLTASSYGVVVGGSAKNSTGRQVVALTTSMYSFTAGPGQIQATWPPYVSGGCPSSYLILNVNSSTVAQDTVAAAECRSMTVSNYGAGGSSYVQLSRVPAAGESPTLVFSPVLSATAPYRTDSLVTTSTATSGAIAGVTVRATVFKDSAAVPDPTFYVSANDGGTWQQALLNQYTPLAQTGNRLRLKAVFTGAAGPGSTYNNQTAYLDAWSADVTQFDPASSVTVSQIDPPMNLAVTKSNGKNLLSWQASATSGVSYNVYRSTDPSPQGVSNLVATRVVGTSLTDGTNLLRDSSFELLNGSWTGTCCWQASTDAIAGQRSLIAQASASYLPTYYQDVAVSAPAGTTFYLNARIKGQQVIESSPGVLGITLTYTDNSIATKWIGSPGGTFDWTTAQVTLTAQKQVSKVRASLQLNGKGSLWFDTVQLDSVGGLLWNDGDIDNAKTYKYRVVAVNEQGVESAPSNEVTTEVTTSTAPTMPAGLGIKPFSPYLGVDLAGGNGYVNLANGNLSYAATDLVYPGPRLAMAFRRTYNSLGSNVRSGLGHGWFSNFDWALTTNGDGSITLRQGDGSTFVYRPTGDGLRFTAPPGSRLNLVKAADGSFTLVAMDTNVLYRFTPDGRLSQLADPDGNALVLGYDGNSRLVSVTDGTGKVMSFSYDGAGNLVQVSHPGGTANVKFSYDGLGNLVQATDMENGTLSYAYDDQHRLLALTDARGNVTSLSYTSAGRVSKVTYPDAASQSLTYDGTSSTQGWVMTTVVDPRGYSYQYEVDSSGLLRKYTYPYGGDTTYPYLANVQYSYDSAWNVSQVTAPNGGVYKIEYDAFGNVMKVTDPQNHVESSVWEIRPYPGTSGQSLFARTEVTNALGNSTIFTVDDRGHVVQTRDPLHRVTRHAYDSHGQLLSVTDAKGRVVEYTYDTNGWLSSKKDGVGARTLYAYGEMGTPTLVTDPLGYQTAYQYDKLGKLKQVTYADGATETYTYDAAGALVQTVNAVGLVTAYEYDNRGRVSKQKVWPTVGDSATVAVTQFTYDLNGNPTSVIDPMGNKTTATYNPLGMRLTTLDVLGNRVETIGYDSSGNVTSYSGAESWSASYDSLNRRTGLTTAGTTYTFTYDTLGNVASQKDALGNTYAYAYDAANQLFNVTDPLGFVTTYGYDEVGNRTQVVDAQRRVTTTKFDANHRAIAETGPDGTTVSTTYDVAGNRVSYQNGRHETIRYAYDNRNRLTQSVYPDRSTAYTYDPAGRRTSMSDSTGTTRYWYNAAGWLLESVDPAGHDLTYSYDLNGRRTQMDLRSGPKSWTWTYGYDQNSCLTALGAPENGGKNTFSYSPGTCRLSTSNYANGDTNVITYSGELITSVRAFNGKYQDKDSTSGDYAGLYSRTYSYDAAGRRTAVDIGTSNPYGPDGPSYEFDADGRVVSIKQSTMVGTPTNRYLYDLVGNRISSLVIQNSPYTGFSAAAYVYDAANRLTEEVGQQSSYHRSYTYDDDGNNIQTILNGKQENVYSYDEEGHLLVATNAQQQETRYAYNGDGQRVKLSDPTGTTYFVFDGSQVVAEADATGNIVVLYSRMLNGKLVSQWQKGATYWYHQDGLGSTIVMTDRSGNITNRYAYDEFGVQTSSNEGVFNRFRYTGQAWDATPGLYFYNARYYNPSIGRFITQDTWKGDPWQPWTQNLYVYVGNNPVNYVDPTGHWAVTIGVGGMLTVIWGVKGELDFTFDDDGNYGFAVTGQGAGGVGVGAGVSGGFYWQADTIDDLAGSIGSIGGSVANIGAEAELCILEDGSLDLCGIEGGYGFSGWAASAYAAAGGTAVWNVKKTIDWLFGE